MMKEFTDRFERCDNCQESWIVPNTVSFWYITLLEWVERYECVFQPNGLDEDYPDHINPEVFYNCLFLFLQDNTGKSFEDDIRFSNDTVPSERKITGYRQTASIIKIDSQSQQGPPLLKDTRWIEDTFGIPGTFSYGQEYLDFESYVTFFEDTITGASLSIAAVLVVILFITASLSTTLIVATCVLLVDLYLLAMIFYWGLTFNSIVVVNICIAIGLSVDYSAHIAHTYLIITPPPHIKEKKQIRHYKASKALSQMGSSVFHGGFSTFLAIAALGPSRSYIFEVFFKCWFSIIFFGMANGFFLLPVIFSYIGPTTVVHTYQEDGPDQTMSKKNEDPKGEKKLLDQVEMSLKQDQSANL